jgi:hypothetical protein
MRSNPEAVGVQSTMSPRARSSWALLFALVISAASSACASDPGDEVCLDQAERIVSNGISPNGVGLNGIMPNGANLNGIVMNGVSMNGIMPNGTSFNGIALNGSELVGVARDGQPISGADMVGTTLSGQLSDGSTLPLRIDAAAPLDGANADVWAYSISYKAEGGWAPLCTSATQAIPLAGTWNLASGVPGAGSWSESSDSFTLACRGAALAKCVELGYKPWKTVDGVLLRDHHQACTRMVRADYCGDGRSWTADGTPINLYDNVGLQADEASWAVDAAWSPEGAVCVGSIRDFQPGTPSCVQALRDPSCGSFSEGVLLVDEYDQECAGPG